MHKKLGVRAEIARAAAIAAAAASRGLGRGSGGMIGGRIARAIDPRLAEKIAQNMPVALITGTNGKSTTTKMTRAALAGLGPVASNTGGDNMFAGILSALIAHPRAAAAALEVDELYLGQVADAVSPTAFVLLNLSRDQLDRTGEIARVEAHIRGVLAKFPSAHVIANCDDPLIACAAWDCENVIWVAAGCAWTADSISFPRTGTTVVREGEHWRVLASEQYRRPQPHYYLEGTRLYGPSGQVAPLELALPGRANLGNAAQAVATAVAFGADFEAATRAVGQVREVAGRYREYRYGGARLRLLLAKNPAGWQEALSVVDGDAAAAPVVVGVNGQIPDGQDLSWLWDVEFEQFRGRHLIACGERGADLAVRLKYAGIDVELVGDPAAAVQRAAQLGAGQGDAPLDVLLNYTAFRDFKRFLDERGETGLEASDG